MGSGHTHRNKRGRGRKNAGGQPRPNGAAGRGNQGAASGRGSSASTPEFLPHASQLPSSEPVAPRSFEEEAEAVEFISVEERETFVVFSSSSEDELDEVDEAADEGLTIVDSGPLGESESGLWAQTRGMEADAGAVSDIEANAPQAPDEPPSPPLVRGRASRLPGIPFARPDSAARREWQAHQTGETHERSMPGERGVQSGYHANALPNGHHEAHGFNGHRTSPRGRPRDEGEMSSHGNGHATGNGERAERWPGAERWASADLVPRADVRGDVGPLIDELRAVFQRDRAVASGTAASRCGICYLHFPLDELEYREAEGFYICPVCARALGAQWLPMVRRQKRA